MCSTNTIRIAVVVIGLFLSTCTKKDDGNLADIEKQLSSSQLKINLLTAKDQSNPIVRITKSDFLYELSFEDGSEMAINPNDIDHIDRDSVNWQATFHFSDGTSASSYLLGKLDITNDMVQQDPYSRSPLTALAKLKMPIKGMFKVIVHGKGQDGITIEKDFSTYDYNHEIPILGLYQHYDNKVEFIFTSESGVPRGSQTLTLTTPAIDTLANIKINKNDLAAEYHGLYIVADLRLGFDQKGEVRWNYTGNGSQFFHKLKNGNFSVSAKDGASFSEVSMLGQIVRKYSVPGSLHHEIKEMPNGNFLVGTNAGDGVTIEDLMIEIDRESGALIKTWDFKKILDPARKSLPLSTPKDWLHLNAIYFDETDNTIVISSRHQSAVIKLDHDTDKIKWILGDHANWNSELAPFLLKPVDSQGNEVDPSQSDFWQYAQHAPMRMDNGHVLLYDNGDYRGYFNNNSVPLASYTRAAEYAIDPQAMTVQLVWEFDDNKTMFTPATGYVDVLKQTNTRLIAYMFGSTAAPRVIEIDANNQILFDANVNLGSNYYRILKLDVYENIP